MLPVIKQKGVVGFSLGVLFFLLTFFPAGPYCGAVTIEAQYGTGFNDTTGLTEEERALLGDSGNNASTLGQARRNAFEHAAGLLEDRLPGSKYHPGRGVVQTSLQMRPRSRLRTGYGLQASVLPANCCT